MKITKRLKDLPEDYYIPEDCVICRKYLGFSRPSELVWVTDGTMDGTQGLCSMKCAREYVSKK